MVRRLGEYRKNTEIGTGNPIFLDFFKENKIEIL